MAQGKTNTCIGSGSNIIGYRYILAANYDSDTTYYERNFQAYNPSVPEGTYIFIDKAYCGSIRTSSNVFYGVGGDGGVSHIFIFEGKESGQTTSGQWAWISNFKVWGTPGTSIDVNWGMDNGGNNGGPRLAFYSDMINNLKINYKSSLALMSIFDSSIIKNLRDFTDLCTVKVSDYIMGTDFQNREELLELEGKESLESWVEELTFYNKVNLTESSFIPYKYFKKVPIEK